MILETCVFNVLQKLSETIVETTKNVLKLVVIYHGKLTAKMSKLILSKMIDFNKLPQSSLLNHFSHCCGYLLLVQFDLNNNKSFIIDSEHSCFELSKRIQNILFMLFLKTKNLKTQSVET